MRWSRIAMIVAVLGSAQLSAAIPLRAQDGGAGAPVSKEEFEAQRRKALDAAAAKLDAVAAFAQKNRLRLTALEMHWLIIEIDSDNRKSRAALGYVRTDRLQWVEDRKKREELRDLKDEDKIALPEFEMRRKSASTAAAAILADVGGIAVRAGEGREATRLWRLARRLDRANATANRALGYLLIGDEWLSRSHVRHREFQREVRATRGRIKAELPSVAMPEESSGVLEALGVACRRVQFGDLRIESDCDYPELVELATTIAVDRAFFRELLEGHNARPEASVCVVVLIERKREKPLFDGERLVLRPLSPPEARRLRNGALVVTAESRAAAVPLVLHDMAHRAVHRAYGETADWIGEGLANVLSNLAETTKIWNCARPDPDTSAATTEGMYVWQAVDALARDAGLSILLPVEWLGRPIEELVRTPAKQWTRRELETSWASVLFLFITDPRAAARYFKDCSGDRNRGADPEVLAKTFPAWKDWKQFSRALDEWAIDLPDSVK